MKVEAQPIYDIRVVDGFSTAHAHYNYKDVGSVPVGHMVENRHIRMALVKSARAEKNITLVTSASVDATERDDYSTRVKLKDKTNIVAPLIIAADGKKSKTREEAGIKVQQAGYNQTAIVCTIEHLLPHEGLALERFLPGGPFAALPMKGNRSAIVWSDADENVRHMLSLSPEAFDKEIASRLGDYLGEIRTVGKKFSYPLFLVLAEKYIDKRFALTGDAAHGIHPIAGQGVNVGFRDVAVLAELIEDALKLGLDIGSDSLLQHYQQWRRFDVVSMGAITDGITRLFSNDRKTLQTGRRLGLDIVNKISPLKKLFMNHAMGLMGDLPRMMREDRAA
jgi:2-octaprenyl-6-methoxyphenol hydroxylase